MTVNWPTILLYFAHIILTEYLVKNIDPVRPSTG
jgi:hypothetical protein